MIPEFGQADLDSEIVFDRVLGRADLDTLQQVLTRLAPKWSTRLRVWRGPRDQRPIDLADAAALGRTVLVAAVGERGPTYRQLVREYGPGPFERMSGSAELRGAGPELVVVVSVDEFVVSTLGTRTLLANAIALQLRRATSPASLAASGWRMPWKPCVPSSHRRGDTRGTPASTGPR